jgi:hypothetical protein
VFERFVPYDVHLLEIMALDDRLYIRKKSDAAMDPFMQQLRVHQRDPAWHRMIYGNPELFHVRHFWRGNIQFEIVNETEECAWFRDPGDDNSNDVRQAQEATDWRSAGLRALRQLRLLRRPLINNIESLLACPGCHGAVSRVEDKYKCDACGSEHMAHPVPNFNEGC